MPTKGGLIDLHVYVDERIAKKIRQRAEERSLSVSDFVEQILGVFVHPDYTLSDLEAQLLTEIGRRMDPTSAAWIVEVARFRGVSALDVILSHVRWGVENGTFYE